MTPDVNLLVAASRRDHPHHEIAAQWLRVAVETGQVSLLPMVVTSIVRVVTNAKIFPAPTSSKIALLHP
jgi:uncharacterized protein